FCPHCRKHVGHKEAK
ncbi:MAG: 50S ribosomal protein L33, partial [Nevskiales bacterium]